MYNLNKYKDNTDMYVGTLTADEIVLAGADGNKNSNYYYYLINDYQRNNSKSWWALSPSDFSSLNSYNRAFFVYSDGLLNYGSVYNGNNRETRSAVSLKTSVKLSSGDGTKGNPYTITLG